MSKEVVKEDDRPSVFNKTREKKDKIKTAAKKLLTGDLKAGYDANPELSVLIAILEAVQK